MIDGRLLRRSRRANWRSLEPMRRGTDRQTDRRARTTSLEGRPRPSRALSLARSLSLSFAPPEAPQVCQSPKCALDLDISTEINNSPLLFRLASSASSWPARALERTGAAGAPTAPRRVFLPLFLRSSLHVVSSSSASASSALSWLSSALALHLWRGHA